MRGSNGNSADGQRLCAVHQRRPGRPAVERTKDSALGRAHINDIGIGGVHSNRRHTAADCDRRRGLPVGNRRGSEFCPCGRTRRRKRRNSSRLCRRGVASISINLLFLLLESANRIHTDAQVRWVLGINPAQAANIFRPQAQISLPVHLVSQHGGHVGIICFVFLGWCSSLRARGCLRGSGSFVLRQLRILLRFLRCTLLARGRRYLHSRSKE